MPPKQAKEHIFNIQDPQINVDIALNPEEGGEGVEEGRGGIRVSMLCSVFGWHSSRL